MIAQSTKNSCKYDELACTICITSETRQTCRGVPVRHQRQCEVSVKAASAACDLWALME